MANRSTPERIAHRTLFDTTVLNSIGKVVITFVCHPTVCSILPGTLQHRPMHARTTTETRENKTHQETNIDNIDNNASCQCYQCFSLDGFYFPLFLWLFVRAWDGVEVYLVVYCTLSDGRQM